MVYFTHYSPFLYSARRLTLPHLSDRVAGLRRRQTLGSFCQGFADVSKATFFHRTVFVATPLAQILAVMRSYDE